jgi:hypothetical protein
MRRRPAASQARLSAARRRHPADPERIETPTSRSEAPPTNRHSSAGGRECVRPARLRDEPGDRVWVGEPRGSQPGPNKACDVNPVAYLIVVMEAASRSSLPIRRSAAKRPYVLSKPRNAALLGLGRPVCPVLYAGNPTPPAHARPAFRKFRRNGKMTRPPLSAERLQRFDSPRIRSTSALRILKLIPNAPPDCRLYSLQ